MASQALMLGIVTCYVKPLILYWKTWSFFLKVFYFLFELRLNYLLLANERVHLMILKYRGKPPYDLERIEVW